LITGQRNTGRAAGGCSWDSELLSALP